MPLLKNSTKNCVFWSEIGSEFGKPSCIPPPKIPGGGGVGCGVHKVLLLLSFFYRLRTVPTNTKVFLRGL